MKKVIKSGVKPEREFKCKRCGCVFVSDEYEESTIRAYKNSVMYEERCPECKRKVIESEEI